MTAPDPSRTLTDDEAELILGALYEMQTRKQEAFDAVHAEVPTFRPVDFAIPQIEALIAKLEGGGMKTFVHYRPAGKASVCGSTQATVAAWKAAGRTKHLNLEPATTDISKVPCQACRKAIVAITEEWQLEATA